ncbi:MAG: TolC family protein [Janthinobacterium lividum]
MGRVSARNLGFCALALLAGSVAQAQTSGAQSGATGNSASGASSSGNLNAVTQVQQQLAQPGPSLTPNSGNSGSQNYRGSVIEGKATAGVLPLTLDDAIRRGLRTNLGLVLQTTNITSANGQRLRELQNLLPTVTAGASITVEQVNLAAYGLRIPGIPSVVGPFQVEDFRTYLNQDLLNLQSIQNFVASKHNFQAAKLSAQDARDLVVLTVGNAYLLCTADAARITAVEAQLASSKVSLDQATAAHEAGTSPRLDVLRAQVDYQNQQQNLISTTNQFEKDKISLARTIGLPLDQKFSLTDTAPYAALDTPQAEVAFQQALKQRKDLAADAEKLQAAKAGQKAAFDEQLPTASVSGDFGDLGETVGHSHSTYTATGQIVAPILQLAKTHGDEQAAAAQRQQAEAQLSDDTQQVNADVRDAILDIQSAAKLVQAARSNVDLADEALREAQERFRTGIADNLPVSQALATDQQANDQYIAALYQHNVAKLELARAMGVATTNYKDYLGGK